MEKHHQQRNPSPAASRRHCESKPKPAQSIELGCDRYAVQVEPKLVVEIAFNDLQASPRYPGGLALRFARVKRYRQDKTAEQADTIEAVYGGSTSRPPASRRRGHLLDEVPDVSGLLPAPLPTQVVQPVRRRYIMESGVPGEQPRPPGTR